MGKCDGTAAVPNSVREKVMYAVQYYEAMSNGIDARVSALELPKSHVHRDQMVEASHYYVDTMTDTLWKVLKELCAELGMDYEAAKEGDTKALGI